MVFIQRSLRVALVAADPATEEEKEKERRSREVVDDDRRCLHCCSHTDFAVGHGSMEVMTWIGDLLQWAAVSGRRPWRLAA